MLVNEEFLILKGEGFGVLIDVNFIFYNGLFVLKFVILKLFIEMVKNDVYWDKENVKIENVKFIFWDGKD